MTRWVWVWVWVGVGCSAPDKVQSPSPCRDGHVRSGSNCIPVADGDSGSAPSVDDTGADTDTGAGTDTGTDTGVSWTDLPRHCDPPAGLPEDPLTELGELNTLPSGTEPPTLLVEMVEVVMDEAGHTVLGVGQGGLLVFDVSDPDAPNIVGTYPDGGHDRFHRVHLLDADDPGHGLAYLTHRSRGLEVVDVSDPESISSLHLAPESGLGGMAQWEDLLYVTAQSGGVLVFDISDRTRPDHLATVGGASNPWTLLATEQALYVADGGAGLVVFDRSDPAAPVAVDTLDLGGVQDLVMGDGVLYAAAGSAGIVALDVSDPLSLMETASVTYGTSIQGIARDGDVLWAVDQEGVVALDISTPWDPLPVGSRVTPQWAMDVAAGGGRAWVGDWGRLGGYTASLPGVAPDLDLSLSEVYLDEAGDEVDLRIRNRGQAPLQLTGLMAGTTAIDMTVTASVVAPGDEATLRLTWPGGALDDTLCLASNDPDEPQAFVDIHTGGGGVVGAVGSAAPDFVLTDLDGETHRLSEHLGHPVVLVYFATW